MPTFTSIPDEAALSTLFEASHKRPVVLFLHDELCPISSMAYDEMLGFDGEVALIDVTSQHEVKRAIESRSGVKHESPQAIVLHNGAAAWHASHGRIEASALAEAIESIP